MPPPTRAKSAIDEFRAAAWGTQEAAGAYVGQAVLAPGDYSKLLAIVVDKKLVVEAASHRQRCFVFKELLRRAPQPKLFAELARALADAPRRRQKAD